MSQLLSHPARTHTIDVPNAEATARVAQSFGASLKAGDAVLLEGDIGAGKTHFARSLIQSRQSVPEDVPSPTFTLVQVYDLDDDVLWHSDLYRLSNPEQVIELGLDEAFEQAISLVEWPDRLGDLAPPEAMTLLFTQTGEGARRLHFRWTDPKWDARFDAFHR